MLQVIRLPRADADIDEIALHFLDERAFDVAERFGLAIDDTLAFIGRFPDVGEQVSRSRAKAPAFRIFPVRGFPNYLIYFRRGENRLVVLRVLHGARHIDPEIFPELPS